MNSLNALLRGGLRVAGVDKAVAYTVASRIWAILAGPITILLIARYFNPVQQGYYYTFNSLIALHVFFELGLSYVVMQVVSHERAKLEFNSSGLLEGEAHAKQRLASLLRLTIKWYGVIAFVSLVVLLVAGYIFFTSNPSSEFVSWRLPWITLVIFTAINLVISPFLSFLEGCGLVEQVANTRLWQISSANLMQWFTMIRGLGLFSLVAHSGSNAFVAATWLSTSKRKFFKNILLSYTTKVKVDWWKEIWPFQWRIALSWLGGYLIYQVFNPILFAISGPIVAGQMGLSLSIVWGLSILAISWVSTKAPRFGMLVANYEFKELDRIFFRSLIQSIIAMILIGIALFTFILILNLFNSQWASRALGPLPFSLLIISAIGNQVIWSEAYYLRAHKKDPLMWISVTVGLLNVVCAYLLAPNYGAFGVALSYSLLTWLVYLPVSSWIFVVKRKRWHHLEVKG